jgi:hypothetical protein
MLICGLADFLILPLARRLVERKREILAQPEVQGLWRELSKKVKIGSWIVLSEGAKSM